MNVKGGLLTLINGFSYGNPRGLTARIAPLHGAGGSSTLPGDIYWEKTGALINAKRMRVAWQTSTESKKQNFWYGY